MARTRRPEEANGGIAARPFTHVLRVGTRCIFGRLVFTFIYHLSSLLLRSVLFRPWQQTAQTGHLLGSMKATKILRHRVRRPSQQGQKVAEHQARPPQNIGPPRHLEHGTRELPKSVAACHIVARSLSQMDPQDVMRGAAHGAVMSVELLLVALCLPASHPGHGHGSPIFSSRLERQVTVNVLKARAPEHLAATGNMGLVDEPVIVLLPSALHEKSPNNPKLRISSQSLQQELDIVGLERDVGVQICNDIERYIPQTLVGRHQATDLCGKIPFSVLRHSHERNRWELPTVSPDDVICPVSRTIAADHPPDGFHGLGNHCTEGRLDQG